MHARARRPAWLAARAGARAVATRMQSHAAYPPAVRPSMRIAEFGSRFATLQNRTWLKQDTITLAGARAAGMACCSRANSRPLAHMRAGRVTAKREASKKLVFLDLQDDTGRLQIMLDVKNFEPDGAPAAGDGVVPQRDAGVQAHHGVKVGDVIGARAHSGHGALPSTAY